MNKVNINVALVRLFQFIVFVLFTFIVIAYFSAMVILPLDAIVMIIKFLSLFGIGGILGALIAIPAVGYLAMVVYKMPELHNLIIEIGVDLMTTGKNRIEAFNKIIDSLKG
ncbi:MAG: hypothetical protein RL755_1815 [Pseudomonadota bacterium]